MYPPFRDVPGAETDEALVARARADDQDAVETLLTRHQPWVFNVAVRMLYHHADAEDATQEILIKVLKALPSFRGESKFSTWLYRIAVNHVLNVKKAKWAASDAVCSFADAAVGLTRVPDLDPPDPSTVPVPFEILVEEVNLYEYLRGNCSLIESGNSCKCARKTRAYIQGGFVDPQKVRFTPGHLRRIRDVVDERADEIREAYVKVADDVFRDHPFCEPAEQVEKLRRVLRDIAPPR